MTDHHFHTSLKNFYNGFLASSVFFFYMPPTLSRLYFYSSHPSQFDKRKNDKEKLFTFSDLSERNVVSDHQPAATTVRRNMTINRPLVTIVNFFFVCFLGVSRLFSCGTFKNARWLSIAWLTLALSKNKLCALSFLIISQNRISFGSRDISFI